MANEGSTGRRWRVYRNTGTYAVPVWTAVSERKDIGLPMTKDEIESLRDGAEFKEYLKGYKDLSFETEIKYTRANANHIEFRTDFMNDDDSYFDLLVLDGASDLTGAQGMRLIVALFDFSHTGPLTDETLVSLVFKPTYAEDTGTPIVSEWYTVS